MTMSQVDVAVIIVNYNTAALTIEAVESVLNKAHGRRSVQVHVVDNASPAGDADLLRDAGALRGWGHRVVLHKSDENNGFGAGNNLVLKALAAGPWPPKYVLLLNPDARLYNEAVGILADFLDTHHTVSAAGARIDSPGGISMTSAFRFPSVIGTFLSAIAFGPATWILRRWEVPLPTDTPTRQVDWVSGAALMLREADLRCVGYFDPAYFLYFEEVDLLKRLTLQGGQVWHVAEARVIHIEGAATGVRGIHGRSNRLPAYWYDSWRHYFTKHLGRTGALAAAAAWYTGAVGNAVLGLLRGRPPQGPDRFYSDFWKIVVRPLLGVRSLPYDRGDRH